MIGKMTLPRQIVSQVLALFVLVIVLFPVLWVVSMALDPRDVARPTSLIPPGASLQAFEKVFDKPTPNPVTFSELAAQQRPARARACRCSPCWWAPRRPMPSRAFASAGRQVGMLGFIIVLMLPSVATVAALFVLLNIVLGPTLRNSILGVGMAMVAGALPFCDLEHEGLHRHHPQGAGGGRAASTAAAPTRPSVSIMLPLALPGPGGDRRCWASWRGWTEFVLSWQFISNPKWFTLSMALYGMQGQYASNTPWSQFAAMSIIVSIPIVLVFFLLQRYIVGGLTAGRSQRLI